MAIQQQNQGGAGAGFGARLNRLADLVEGERFQRFITVLILVNAVTLGLETSATAMAHAGLLLTIIDKSILTVFAIEVGIKLAARRGAFFKSGWNVFDFIIVGIALVPATGNLSVLRALRILRVLRLMSVVPQMRRVVGALIGALPGMGSILGVLLLVFYVAAVLATKLFGPSFPQWFGDIGASMFSLFQVMTLESWSMGIVRPVMEVYPLAWAFFVPFIFLTSFMVLNLFIAIIVNSMQALHDSGLHEEIDRQSAASHAERETILKEVRALRREIGELRKTLKPKG